jgi:probable phosphoglycerate mutase
VTRIVLVRHGHVEGIDPPRFRGRMDVPLSELGERQAELTAERLSTQWRPSAIYSSPLQRALQTSQAIGRRTGMSVQSIEGLHDLDYGEWQWKTFDEARRLDPVLFEHWFSTPHLVRFPGGDCLQDLVLRTADALRMALSAHAAQTVVLVGHDSVNRALLLQVLDMPLSAYWRLAQSPCAISEVVVEAGKVQVARINETAHLEMAHPALRA